MKNCAYRRWGKLRNTSSILLNPFVSNAPFLYPLKASENRKVFWCFQGVEKGYIGKNGLNLKNLMDNEVLLLILNISSDGT